MVSKIITCDNWGCGEKMTQGLQPFPSDLALGWIKVLLRDSPPISFPESYRAYDFCSSKCLLAHEEAMKKKRSEEDGGLGK